MPTLRRLATAMLASLVVVAGLAMTTAAPAYAQGETVSERDADEAYLAAIDATEAIVWNDEVIALAAEHGLDVVNVAWEDTGRYDNSSVGPNISDVTIQVARPIAGTDEHTLSLMPVIRHPNFADQTGDVAIEKFYVPVGNEDGSEGRGGLRSVTLEEYLGNIGRYLSDDGGVTPDLSLLAERDTHVLVSAQAALLPVPQQGIAEFNPVIFNYQSYVANPAVLTIVVTAEGTSATIIDNERDGFSSGGSWGQRLFFNHDGDRASLTGERASDVAATADDDEDAEGLFADPAPAATVGESDSNVVLIIQVPLKHEGFAFDFDDYGSDCDGCDYAVAAESADSDVEDAIIGHGDVEGPFTELAGLQIERDPDFPVRVTVQYYKATATGEITADDMDAIAADIERVYDDADYVGSLVTDGLTGRPTEYEGNVSDHTEPNGWWAAFFSHHPGLFPAVD